MFLRATHPSRQKQKSFFYDRSNMTVKWTSALCWSLPYSNFPATNCSSGNSYKTRVRFIFFRRDSASVCLSVWSQKTEESHRDYFFLNEASIQLREMNSGIDATHNEAESQFIRKKKVRTWSKEPQPRLCQHIQFYKTPPLIFGSKRPQRMEESGAEQKSGAGVAGENTLPSAALAALCPRFVSFGCWGSSCHALSHSHLFLLSRWMQGDFW